MVKNPGRTALQASMKLIFLGAFVIVWSVSGAAAAARAETTTTAPSSATERAYDAMSLSAELNRLDGLLQRQPTKNQMAELRDALPKKWTLTTPERTYSISTEPLRNELTALSSKGARTWVERLDQEIADSSSPTAEDSGKARAELDSILARPEFNAVRPPSAWELLKQRIAAWIERLLLRFFGVIGEHPMGGKILFWVIIIAAVLGIGLVLFRFLSTRERISSLPASESVVRSLTWQEWIRISREAARRGDFREAVHSAYWAGIVRLQDASVMPKDSTRTPREYLRLATDPPPDALPVPANYRQPLANLTSRLEYVWYANRGAAAEDFNESLRQLEALGCQLE